jgi:hypothetical protein
MVDAEKRALVVHVVARAMEVDDAQILWEEIEERSDPFEMQVNDAAEAFADALIAAAKDRDFWETEHVAGDWATTEIMGAYTNHLGAGLGALERYDRYLSHDENRRTVLATGAQIALRILNPGYYDPYYPDEEVGGQGG